MKAIGYARVSTDKQADFGVSLEAQAEKVRAMAVVQGAELVDVIVDAGESAKSLDRTEPDEGIVIETIEAGGGASADDICAHLKALWLKGCKPGKAKGPHGFGWFVTVTRQHFSDQKAMEDARLNPNAVTRWSEKQADRSELDAGMDAF